ncbi:MAG: hypothetical protein KTR17_11285, partial [Cellvibrionaceae bacterium]|nr:hypothetical protein [Cellvibrionaceae bacterium]
MGLLSHYRHRFKVWISLEGFDKYVTICGGLSPTIHIYTVNHIMLAIFSPKLIDKYSADSLLAHFQWFLQNFDGEYFYRYTDLVYPTRASFPDQASKELDMAKSLCSRIMKYSGLSHLPIKLVPPQELIHEMPPVLNIDVAKRGSLQFSQSRAAVSTHQHLEISYSGAMMKKPMDLVATMSKHIAQHYLFQSQLIPPLGMESFDATSELLAVFMGFGIMIANSAYTFRGSCARCYDPRANRNAALS